MKIAEDRRLHRWGSRRHEPENVFVPRSWEVSSWAWAIGGGLFRRAQPTNRSPSAGGPELRRRCHAGLNKSEQRIPLAQVICAVKQGQAQQFRASGLNLVISTHPTTTETCVWHSSSHDTVAAFESQMTPSGACRRYSRTQTKVS